MLFIVYFVKDESARARDGSCFSFFVHSLFASLYLLLSHSPLSLSLCALLFFFFSPTLVHKEPKIKYFRLLHIEESVWWQSKLFVLSVAVVVLVLVVVFIVIVARFGVHVIVLVVVALCILTC